MFSSIGVNIRQAADANRITVLSLIKPPPELAVSRFAAIQKAVSETINHDWCASLRARTLNLVSSIVKNADTFSRAIAVKYDQRTGDQYGTMLAGAYSLASDGIINMDNALAWIDNQDLSDNASSSNGSDERRCLNHILESVIRYQGSDERSWIERSIGEILYEDLLNAKEHEALARAGIKYDEKKNMCVSGTHASIKSILSGTPWEGTWYRILRRLDGTLERNLRINGSVHRTVVIPRNIVFPDEVE
jgi:putative DNA primase/helicase